MLPQHFTARSPPAFVFPNYYLKFLNEIFNMKPSIICCTIFIFLAFSVNAQLEKGNWLVGGNASFSTVSSSYDQGTKITNAQIAPQIGYFFWDKFSVGLISQITFNHSKTYYGSNPNAYKMDDNSFALGPCLRYYFLDEKKIMNVFVEGSYEYGIDNSNNRSQYLLFNAGPEFFFTPSVGLEFTVGYYYTTYFDSPPPAGIGNQTSKGIQMGIGIKAHLIKDK
jgi:hypothetical protein